MPQVQNEIATDAIVTVESTLPAMLRARTPRFIYRMGRLIWLALVIFILALLFVPWQQNVRGEGRVVAYLPTEREQSVDAPVAGRVVEWFVGEGSRVKAGDRLFRIADNDPGIVQRLSEQRDAVNATLAAAQSKARLYQQSSESFAEAQRWIRLAADEHVRQAEQKVIAAQQKLEAANAGIEIANWRYDRQKQLRDDGLTSVQNYEKYRLEQRKAAAERAQSVAELAAAEANVVAKRAERDQKNVEIDTKIQSVQAQREDALSDVAKAREKTLHLDVKITRQQSQDVTASSDGIVQRLLASRGARGQFVKAGEPVLTFVPVSTSSSVELWVDGNDQTLIEVGRRVRLQFEGWPAAVFAGGWPQAALGTFGGIVQLMDPVDDGRGSFRILVTPDAQDEPWPQSHFLRQGVQVRGWVLLEQVTLGYEFWRQLNGFPPNRVVSDPTEKSAATPKGAKG